MKFLKGLFPSGKKTIGTILMVAAGVMVWNVVNSKYNVESKVSRNLPGGTNGNMEKVA